MENVFKIENLNLYYGTKQALKNINLDLYKNQVTAFIGPSGCGKSTLLRCLNRMNDLYDCCRVEGTILYEGQDISKLNTLDLRTKVGMVFQNPNPFPMSIYDNIAYGPRCQGVKNKDVLNKIVEESLKKAALYDEVKDRLKDSALGLSGGQQQRLCIARCIAMEPDVILMDEPTSALDPIATLKIEELINELKKEYTIIIVTHNMQQATRVSDYTAFFMLGEVIECAPTVELFSQPKNKKNRRLYNRKVWIKMNLIRGLEYLENSMMHMADLVVKNLELAFDSYLNYSDKEYPVNDDIVDNLERMIEGECMHLLLTERPFARDLRKVSGILKLISDLERLGDHAEDVLEFALKLKNTEKHTNDEINQIVEITLNMVKDSIDSYIKQDINLAQTVIDRDDIIDKMYAELIDNIIKMSNEGTCSSSFAVYTTLVVKYIERIADHAVNIAEWVIYIISGFHKDKKII